MNQLDKNIATNLKRIRKSRNMSLDMMSEQTGVSKSMLGQIERGESNPTVNTIGKIVEGIRISFEDLITTPPKKVEILEKKDILMYDENGCQVFGYRTYDSKKDFEVYEIKIMPGEKYDNSASGDRTHKLVIVDEGCLKLVNGEEEFVIEKGNAIDFIADKAHVFCNEKADELTIKVVFYTRE